MLTACSPSAHCIEDREYVVTRLILNHPCYSRRLAMWILRILVKSIVLMGGIHAAEGPG